MDHTNNQQSQDGADQLHPNVSMETFTLPALTMAQWFRLPAVVRYFHPWERARRPLVIEKATKRAVEIQMGGSVKLETTRQV